MPLTTTTQSVISLRSTNASAELNNKSVSYVKIICTIRFLGYPLHFKLSKVSRWVYYVLPSFFSTTTNRNKNLSTIETFVKMRYRDNTRAIRDHEDTADDTGSTFGLHFCSG